MKKVFKKVVSMTMAFTMAFGGLSYTKSVDASSVTDEWKANAVITPAEGKLIGAGYIDVEFDNSMEGYTYTVLLDGQPMYWDGDDIVRTDIGETVSGSSEIKTFTSQDVAKTEVYTTSVSKHEITVKAVKGSEEIISDTRTFYVSKKGLALGDDMTDKIAIQKLNCSWYYNWGTKAFANAVDENVDHVPMMWGNRVGDEPNNKDHKNDIEDMENLSTTSNYIMGFNEPDIGSQANMKSFVGIRVWKQYIDPLGLRTVSPAPADPNGATKWITEFLNGVMVVILPNGQESKYLTGDPGEPYFVEGVDCDSIALHYYRGNTDINGLLNSVKSVWNAYHKPVWVTEVSVMGRKNTSYDYSYDYPGAVDKTKAYVTNIVNELDKLPYVERYCWFPYDVDATSEIDGINGSGATALFEFGSGLYTELGILYSEIGNPEGYNSCVIKDNEKFVWENRLSKKDEVTTQEVASSTQVPVTTVEKAGAVTKAPVSKIGKVKIGKPKNVKKRSVKLSWKKLSGAKKYQIQYSLDKKFAKKIKKKTVSKLSYTFKKMKKNKTYYFRVRGIGSNGNGAWSDVKSVTIKK